VFGYQGFFGFRLPIAEQSLGGFNISALVGIGINAIAKGE
jgi:hypothetical protein